MVLQETFDLLRPLVDLILSAVSQVTQAVVSISWPYVLMILLSPAPHLIDSTPTISLPQKEVVAQTSPILGAIIMIVVFGGIGVGLTVTILRDKMHQHSSENRVS